MSLPLVLPDHEAGTYYALKKKRQNATHEK